MEGDENGGSQQPSCSDAGQTLALRKLLENEIEPMVLNIVRRVMKPMVTTTVQQVIVPVAEDLFRRVVKEEIQCVEEKLLTGRTRAHRNDLPKEGSLRLKFSDKVSDTMTGEKLKGIKDECLELALVDSNEHIVTCGDESSANVEILLLDNNGGDDESEITQENFVRRIIGVGEKKKPHFAQRFFISLKNGVGDLSGLKLGHDSDRIKLWRCRLGAKIAQNLEIIVQEAWSEPFEVVDKRDKQYEKHYPPILSSEVWRLEKIARKGNPRKCLEGKNIKTLQDFLFWFYVNAEELRQILPVGDGVWKSIYTHAETCKIDDKRLFSHKSCTQPEMCVVYDAVGKLKGVINESHFVPFDNLSADKKDHARKLLSSLLEPSAFGDRYNVEASLPQEFPYRSSDMNASTNSSLHQCSNGSVPSVSENISGYQAAEQRSSSQSINPNNLYDAGPSDSLGSTETGELCNPASGSCPDPKFTDGGTPTDLGTLDYEKHETPSLFDEVSRLVNICKDGEIHKCLQDNRVNSVEDFLIQLLIDHEGLKKIVNLEREEWEATVSHARACPTPSRMYCYISLEQNKGVVFNVLGHVLGLCFDNLCYPTSILSEKDEADAQELLASACRNWGSVKPFNNMSNLQQHLTALGGGSGASEMVGESSSRRSNASFHSVSSTMVEEKWNCFNDGDNWGTNVWCHCPPSPNPMLLQYVDDGYSYNTQMYGHRNDEESSRGDDEGSGAAASAVPPQLVDPPRRWKKLSRLWFSFKERMSKDVSRCHKKRKFG